MKQVIHLCCGLQDPRGLDRPEREELEQLRTRVKELDDQVSLINCVITLVPGDMAP